MITRPPLKGVQGPVGTPYINWSQEPYPPSAPTQVNFITVGRIPNDTDLGLYSFDVYYSYDDITYSPCRVQLADIPAVPYIIISGAYTGPYLLSSFFSLVAGNNMNFRTQEGAGLILYPLNTGSVIYLKYHFYKNGITSSDSQKLVLNYPSPGDVSII